VTLVALPPDARRARRHPRALAGLYAWQSVLALVVAGPAASLVGGAYGSDPRGDGPLFAAGSRALLDLLWHEQHGIRAVGALGQTVLVVAAVAGLVPVGAVLAALACGTPDGHRAGFARSMERGLRAFPALLALLVGLALVALVLGFFGFAVADVVEAWCHKGWGEPVAQTVGAIAVVPVLLLGSLVLVLVDMARAAVVRFEVGAGRSLAYGLVALRAAPLALWWSWAWRWVVSLVPVVVALLLHQAPLIVLLLLHQAAVIARVALRASWWARTLRGIDDGRSPALPEPGRN
jgi:hypothetical protein